MKKDSILEHLTEFMNELDAYHNRTIVLKIGGNAIAEDEHFLAKIAKQIKFLHANGVDIILIHGGGPQIDQALRDKKIETSKGADGRRLTSPKAMRVVAKVMSEINREVGAALIEAGCPKDKIFLAAKHPRILVQAEPLDAADGGVHNRSGKPKSVVTQDMRRALDDKKIVVLHSVGVGADRKTLFNINGDDYAMAVAIAMQAKRLILVTNVDGVWDKNRRRIAVIDQEMANELIASGTVTGGMVPKVESALWVVKQGVGGVAIIDGFKPWTILAEMLTHDGFGTLFRERLG